MLRRTVCFSFLLIAALVLSPAHAHAQSAQVTTIHTFCALTDCTDGTGDSTLVQASDGNFYGTSQGQGPLDGCATEIGSCGIIYEVSPQGVFNVLYNFCTGGDPCSDGAGPAPNLVQGADGALYGLTYGGGANNHGTAFKVTLSGTLTTLHSFCGESKCADGLNPNFLVQGVDGNFYGTTYNGGATSASPCAGNIGGCGTIFQLTPSGTFKTIYVFCNTSGTSCPDGEFSTSNLVQGADGNFYGLTEGGGTGAASACPDPGSCGTFFKVTPLGTLTTLYSFCTLSGCADGYDPIGGLVQASDGNFYGLTFSGAGTFFKVSPSGSLTTLHQFCSDSADCTDGIVPLPFPFLGADGNFYLTSTGGPTESTERGNILRLTPAGALNTLYSFCTVEDCPDGIAPFPITQASDGGFYGTTQAGGPPGAAGVVFRAVVSPAVGAPIKVNLSSSSIAVETPVTLTWQVFNAFSKTLQQCYAFVQNGASGAGTWTGLQPGTLTNGIFQGTATITPTAAGVYSYSLTCGGTETGISGSLSVGGAKVATSTVMTPIQPVTVGSAATLTATVSTSQYVGPLTGSFTFTFGSSTIGTVPVTNGTGSLNITTHTIPIGIYPIVATYSGDTNYSSSVSTPVDVIVQGYTTQTTLTASPVELAQGQATTLTATVIRTSVNGIPTGNVTFSYNGKVIGTSKISNGKALFTAATYGGIPAGTYGVTATYRGDSQDQSSVSQPVYVTLIAATQTTLSVTPNPLPANSAATLVTTVKESHGSAIPTGTVTFWQGGYFIGTVLVDGTGTALLHASDAGLAPRTYAVTAKYSGDDANAASISPAVNVVVQ